MHATDVWIDMINKVTVNVFTFQRSKQDAWSICRFGDIPIEPNSRFKYIVKIQFTGFNSQLVLLLVTIQRENIIWFQYQTDVENPDPPEIWNITQPGLADEILSSPSTGKVLFDLSQLASEDRRVRVLRRSSYQVYCAQHLQIVVPRYIDFSDFILRTID